MENIDMEELRQTHTYIYIYIYTTYTDIAGQGFITQSPQITHL